MKLATQQTAGETKTKTMKTLILKKSELDKLPEDCQKQITQLFKDTEISIKELKARIAKLKYPFIDYRSDIGEIEARDETPNGVKYENLVFDVWHKTEGEQWGNCEGFKFTFRLGRKYIRVDVYHYCGQRNFAESKYLSEAKLSEILDLVEEAEVCKDEIDSGRIYQVAAQRLYAMFGPEYY